MKKTNGDVRKEKMMPDPNKSNKKNCPVNGYDSDIIYDLDTEDDDDDDGDIE